MLQDMAMPQQHEAKELHPVSMQETILSVPVESTLHAVKQTTCMHA